MASHSNAAGRSPCPDGIDHGHIEPHGPLGRHASPLSMIVLACVVGAGLSGAAGSPVVEVASRSDSAVVSVEMPAVIRTGKILEMRFHLRPSAAIDKPVLAIDESLWHELTINSMLPAATDEAFRNGAFRFSFDRIQAGDDFLFKVDAQVNPRLRGVNRGRVVLLDGEREVAAVPVELKVWP